MEAINGITFIDWACACGNLAQGMPEEEILKILGVEAPVWQQTSESWIGKLGDIMANDMEMATKYGEIFANPKQGKFANVEQVGASDTNLEAIVPDYETYQKIFWHQSVAAEYGIDAVTVLESYGLDLGSWGKMNMKFMNAGLNSTKNTDPDYNDKFFHYSNIMQQWQDHWHEHYKENKVDLSDDIDF